MKSGLCSEFLELGHTDGYYLRNGIIADRYDLSHRIQKNINIKAYLVLEKCFPTSKLIRSLALWGPLRLICIDPFTVSSPYDLALG